MKRIYLDHAATTLLLPAAKAAMEEWLSSGNASSLYSEGRAAKAKVDEAREVLSLALGCLFAEVIFTSGATEAASMAIIGSALGNAQQGRNRVLMSAAEHPCVLQTRPILERLGYLVELVPVDREARIDLGCLEDQISDDVLLVCAMHANNELGTFSDIPWVARICELTESMLFVDAVQSFGAQPLPLDGINLLAVTGHKIGGPKGAGALFIRAGTKIEPIIAGGGQERELRGGTENVSAIAGFAAAVAHREPPNRLARDAFQRAIGGAVMSATDVLPGHCHVRFPGLDGETVVIRLDREGISASSGAACSSGSTEASQVLLACGYSQEEAKEGVRFTFGPQSSVEEAEEAAARVNRVVSGLREAKN